MNDEMKKRVIDLIDYFLETGWSHTAYRLELKNMRSKYIYKDISPNQFRDDIKWLKCLRDINTLNGNKKQLQRL
jgi:hypothetical protein